MRLAEASEVLYKTPVSSFLRADARFPAALHDLSDPPEQLFALGQQTLLDRPAVAIVGTRHSTGYGERTTRNIARQLSRAGACVVSGMARGIDAAAHRAALEESGSTIAVLGTGIDVAYPVAHRRLHAEIGARGLVLSENEPGATAHRGAFPKRNRIIAALARVTIVVEAGHKSGALNTAAHALELGRVVAAVPGQIDSEQSAGTNQLLRDGATLIASVSDALALMGLGPAPVEAALANLPDSEQRVWEATGFDFTDSDTIGLKTGLTASACLAAITSLELLGLVECSLAGGVRRR